jgi:manganese-dependent inorganic pyrophosphatase
MIYIIGHLKPDLDSAVSACALQYLFDRADCFQRKNSQAVLADPPNWETKTIFKKFGYGLPQVLKKSSVNPKDQFVLVDHNEESQRFSVISSGQITDIFDHHKISLNTAEPIFVTIKPWGSTSTLIFWLMEIADVKPDKKLASLMITAILSDTVGLKSKTTTEKDHQVLKKLNNIAKIKDVNKLTYEIFKAKSYIADLKPRQILTKDYKIYKFGSKKVLINQIETVEQQQFVNKNEFYAKELKNIKQEMKLDLAFCLITDVLKVNSKCLITEKETDVLNKAFKNATKITKFVWNLGSVMSRKKEIAPAIEKALQ